MLSFHIHDSHYLPKYNLEQLDRRNWFFTSKVRQLPLQNAKMKNWLIYG